MSGSTLPGLLIARAKAAPTGVALRFFRQGKWNEVTNAGLLDRAAAIGAGLADLGVKPNDVVAVLSEDGTGAFAAELGAQGIGAVVLALDPEASSAEVRAIIARAGAVVAFVSNQEQFDKIDEGRSEVPAVRSIVVDATRGLRHLEAADRDDRNSLLTSSQLGLRGNKAEWERTVGSVSSDGTARVAVVNGQVVNSTHRELIEAATQVSRLTEVKPNDSLFSLHPLSDSFESALLVAGPLMSGATAHFGGHGITTRAIQQVQPTLIHATPEWLAQLDAEASRQVAQSRGVKGAAVRRGLRAATPASSVRSSRRALSEPTRVAGLVCAAVVFLFLLVSVRVNDVLRLLICVLIISVSALGLVFSGHAVAGPLRRRFGLSRCRAVLRSESLQSTQQDLLGALGIPVVSVQSEVNS